MTRTKWRWSVLVVWLGVSLSLAVIGQPKLRGSIEIASAIKDHPFTVINVGRKGILLVQRDKKSVKGKIDFKLILIDTALASKAIGSLKLDSHYDLVGYDVDAQRKSVFLLFQRSGYASYDLQLASIKLSDRSLEWFSVRHGSNLDITHFVVAGRSALLGGYVSQRPVVMIYKMDQRELMLAPGFFKKKSKLLDIRVNENITFSALTLEENLLRNKYLVAQIFSSQGKLLVSDSVTIAGSTRILSGLISGLQRKDLIVMGSYTRQSTQKALGVYTVFIDPVANSTIRYYRFSELRHFFDYLGEEQADKMKLKVQKRKELGKYLNYFAYVNPVEIREDAQGYALIAEMMSSPPEMAPLPGGGFYPGYNAYQGNPFYDARSRWRGYPRGYNQYTAHSNRYVQSLLLSFDGKGRLMWDASVNMEEMEQESQMRISDFIKQSDSALFACKGEGQLMFSVVSDSGSVRRGALPLTPENPLSITLRDYTENTGIYYWYDRYFFTWGYRDIRYAGGVEKDKHVFYGSKVEASLNENKKRR